MEDRIRYNSRHIQDLLDIFGDPDKTFVQGYYPLQTLLYIYNREPFFSIRTFFNDNGTFSLIETKHRDITIRVSGVDQLMKAREILDKYYR